MFNIGDKVSYPMHGAGVITEISKKELLGEVKDYYTIKIPVNEVVVSVPVDKAEDLGLRPIIEKDELDGILETLKAEAKKTNGNWSKRHRNNFEKLKSGDIIEVAEVVRDLTLLSKERNLSGGDRRMLTNSMNLLLSEIIMAYDVDEATAIKRIEECILE
ncbi:CarD family transcriptional regulator [Ezakiella peruensis]|uniref:CarD family transcriptional regulator n=1 Tax=Ezakiella peruensis TaxID=1464038 RepID=UPI000C1B5AEE|nr:CarD family transcriptional regulator [Ezakiella peruensis]